MNNLVLSCVRKYSTNIKKRICIVGAGPAGFYAAQYLLKHLENTYVDLIEKLPVPYGLVRYGVAPDHPEVKNVINTFKKVAEHPSLRYFGNVTVGSDVQLQTLRENYHCVVLAYGAQLDNRLNLQNEDAPNFISARHLVAWYNGLPGYETLDPHLDEKVTIIGQGNVAVDVARILLSPIRLLEKTDITEIALEKLRSVNVKEVHLIGRRGPLHAAFTIKELREMLKLPGVSTVWRENDFNNVDAEIPNLQRPRKRLIELMLKSLKEQNLVPGNKQFCPIFFRSPVALKLYTKKIVSATYTVNTVENGKAIKSNSTEEIPTNLMCKSIGYRATALDESLNFDAKMGHIKNFNGHVLAKNTEEKQFEHGLYTTGWVATGPTGVLITTMNTSFSVADRICKDFQRGDINLNDKRTGIDFSKVCNAVDWKQWEKIDKVEISRGKKLGKPREKILDVKEMLNIVR